MPHEDSEKQTEHALVAIVSREGNATNPILVFSMSTQSDQQLCILDN